MEMPAEVAPEQHEKEARKRIEPYVHRQIRQTDGQDGLLGSRAQAEGSHGRERDAAKSAERKKHPTDKTYAHRAQQTGHPDQRPKREEREASAQR